MKFFVIPNCFDSDKHDDYWATGDRYAWQISWFLWLVFREATYPPNYKPNVLDIESDPPPKKEPTMKLSSRERALIKQHLQFYLALADGSRQPTAKAQEHFLAVCRFQADASTEHEWAFVKWRASKRK